MESNKLFVLDQLNPKPFVFRNRTFCYITTPEILEQACQFQFLPTDVIIATFARSGTTFTQEIIWQIVTRKVSKKDEQGEMLNARMPFIEFNYKIHPNMPTSFEMLESQKNDPQRFIKTHLPFEFFQESFEKNQPKMIIVMRNVKDCMVSNFKFASNFPVGTFKGSFDEYFDKFINNKLEYGSYFDNNIEYWQLRNRENVLILFYEDLVLNLQNNVLKIAQFLGQDISSEEMDKIVHNCSFSTMFKNPKVNYAMNDSFSFLRKGIIGDWKNHLSKEQNDKLNEIIENRLEKVGLKFIYE